MEITYSSILSDAELHQIVTKAIGEHKTWKLLKVEDRRASEELAGFLGDHRRMTICLDVDGQTENINLFLKLMPTDKNKAAFIKESKFFSREAFTLDLIGKIVTPDPYPWCTTAYIKNENMIAMPDLGLQGYTNRITNDLDDLPHALLTADALARFHAAFANYETSRKETIPFIEQYGDQLQETVFLNVPPILTGILSHKKFLNAFSEKYKNIDVDLVPFYMEAYKSVTHYDNTLNTLIHRDLWTNNVMYNYENGVPVNSLLVDFQIARYAPPAFDPITFLYMTTSKTFREQHKDEFLRRYFNTFMEKVDENTKKRLEDLKYDWNSFREWCEKARFFALACAMYICPIAFIDSVNLEKMFSNEKGYGELLLVDRSEPIIKYAKQYPHYNQKLLDMYEEFMDIVLPCNEVQ